MTEEKKQKFDLESFFHILIIIVVCLSWIFLGFNLKFKKEKIYNNETSAYFKNDITPYSYFGFTSTATDSFLFDSITDDFTSTWSVKSWNNLTSFSGGNIWSDGTNIYYSSSSNQYVLDKSTSTWSAKTWTGFSNLNGSYIWTDGTNIYYSLSNSQYVLDISTSTWSSKTWTGLTSFSGNNVWSDGSNIYYSGTANQYVLDKSTSTWSVKIWNGLTRFSGNNVWTDGTNIYYSESNTHYVLDISTSTWSAKIWNGYTDFRGAYTWTDSTDIYYSEAGTNYILNKNTSTWSLKNWNGLTSFRGSYVWSDGSNIYFSSSDTQYILNKLLVLDSPVITLDYSIFPYISWSSVFNADSYEIYKNGQLYDTTINTSYTVDSLGDYQVIAVGDGINYLNSELSNTITISSIQLNTPVLSLNDFLITWSNIQNAVSYNIYLDNVLIDNVNTTSYEFEFNGDYQVQAVSNSVFFTNSNLSSVLTVNYNYAEVVFFAKDNITELIHIENWLVGKSIYNFSNFIYSYNNLLLLISNENNIDISYFNSSSVFLIFNDNQLFNNISFDENFIVSSDINIYYKIEKSFNSSYAYDINEYSVTSSNDSTIFSNLGSNLIHNIGLSTIDVTFDWLFCGSVGAQTSSILSRSLTLLDGFELGDNFSIYTDSLGNNFYFDCVVSQSSLTTRYINYLYKVELNSNSFYFPSMDYNKFVFYNESTQQYQFIQSSSSLIVSYSGSIFETTFKYNQNSNFYYCNYIGFSFNVENYVNSNDNKLFSFVQDSNFKYYQYFYNYSNFNNNLSNFNYILINSNNFNNFLYNKTYLYFDFISNLSVNGLSTTYNNKSDCIAALENLSIKFSFGNPILYYYDSTDKINSATGTGIIPTSSDGLYKTDFAWYDVTAYIYNFFIFLIFDMPIVSNITKLVYQIIQLILFVINQIILLFGSVSNNIFLVAILGFLLLKFVIYLLVKH